MSDRSFDQAVRDWLEDGSDRTPPTAIDAVLLAVKTTPQERDLRIPRRFTLMTSPVQLAAGIAIVAVAGVAALAFLRPGQSPGIGTTSPSPSPSASRAPSPTPDPLDTNTWKEYTSTRYGFAIRYPSGWADYPASHDWTLETDGTNWLNTGAEVFQTSVDGGIRVSVWSVAVAPGTTLQQWLETYCPKTVADSDPQGCTGIEDRALPASMDGHPGLLVPFSTDVQAFFLVDGRIYAIACWQADDHESVAKYSGSRRLVQTFLSTMTLLPGGPASADAATSAS